jgi:hypothetical protein
MPSRMIRSHRDSQMLKDSLSSFLSLEMVKPSKEIYIISPWIGNSPIFDNTYNQFKDMFPFVESNTIYLSDVLLTLSWFGSKVRLICNPDHKHTGDFIQLLGNKVEYRLLEDNHEKGLFTENFYLHGSMNFTYFGININGECIRITTTTSEVNSAFISARSRWEESVFYEYRNVAR